MAAIRIVFEIKVLFISFQLYKDEKLRKKRSFNKLHVIPKVQ